MPKLLHEAYLLRLPFVGKKFCNSLADRVQEVHLATKGLKDPDISVVIRSQNKADELELLFEDILKQSFDGKVEIILVDTESSDGTVAVAKRYRAKVITIKQSDFSYPKALNKGFEAASHKWVYTLTDHGVLSNDQIFRIATRSEYEEGTGGVSGITLPNTNASRLELVGNILGFLGRVRKPAKVADKMFMGILGANTSLVNREAWRKVGGFDEGYGAGGEDSALAATLTESGFKIIVDPAMSVHHTHGLGLIDSLRQFHYWTTLDKPRDFEQPKLARFRQEFRSPKK